MNYCRNCQHHRDGAIPETATCVSPDVADINPVTGTRERVLASDARRHYNLCGAEGKWFEARPKPTPTPVRVWNRLGRVWTGFRRLLWRRS